MSVQVDILSLIISRRGLSGCAAQEDGRCKGRETVQGGSQPRHQDESSKCPNEMSIYSPDYDQMRPDILLISDEGELVSREYCDSAAIRIRMYEGHGQRERGYEQTHSRGSIWGGDRGSKPAEMGGGINN